MMNKMRSAKLHLVKFLFVLPLLVVVLLAFRNQDNRQSSKLGTISGAVVLPDQRSNDILVSDTVPSPKKATVSPRAARIVEPNNKGYVVTIADNHGECLVIIRDKQNKIVKAMSLVEWNDNEKKYTSQYGQIPPPPSPVEPPNPPVAIEAPFPGEDISEINVKGSRLTIVLKNGQTEVYNLDNPEQKAVFEKKFHLKTEMANFRMQMRKESMKVDTAGKVSINTLGDFDGLIFVDGKEYDKKSFEKNVVLASNDIKSMEVFKGESATQLYGEKGKKGVIRIVTKEGTVNSEQ